MFMSVTALFLDSLRTFLIKRAARPMLDYTLTILDEELRKLDDVSPPPEWQGGRLTPEQRQFVAMLPALQGDVSTTSHVRSWLRQAPKRGIILLGPSGVGKSQIDLRLRGKAPREDILYTAEDEARRLVLQGRRVPLLDTPGEPRHAMSGYANVLDVMVGSEPPAIAVIVVAGGYLATSMPELRATFIRPNSRAKPVAHTTDEFVSKCREEEATYLRELVDHCRAHAQTKGIEPVPQQRLRSVITVVNKRDLWGATSSEQAATLARYRDPDSAFGVALQEFRDAFGAPDQHSHDVLPLFTHANGFHPDPTIAAQALTPFHSALDALILRTLVSYRYTGGGRIP
ncbi:hypothetical protein ENSA5_37840 [Enhygromyxa salina]|uniref:Uncharacterized protein n=1 Tax=Enhygromyxa salina TaxID=215803 RepID=A0A2S9XSG7_9BACT|nr:hypothetical protein [Enhygromyxa salina]PRP95651.1 hypothetical protein ENSA5_37840 [Enhygromyxa salina]